MTTAQTKSAPAADVARTSPPFRERLAAARARPGVRRAALLAGIALYVAIWAYSGNLPLNDTDFDVFFFPSARIALAGHPLHIYTVLYQVKYPNANGPLTIAPMTVVAWVEQQLGWLDNRELRRMLMMAVFAVFPLLVGREALLALDRLRARPLAGWWRFVAFCLIVLSPELWHSVLLYGHLEHPIMLWLLLAGVRMLTAGRPGRGGALLGLALLTRSSALLYLIALGLTLLVRRHWRAALVFGGAALATVAGGLAPFLIADSKDTLYSLVTFRAQLGVGGGTIWGAIANNQAITDFAQQHDSLVIAAAAIVLTLLTLAIRRDLDVTSRDLYGLLAIAGLCFPLFIKTLWPYYFLEAYILVTLWWLAGAASLHTTRDRVLWLLAILAPAATIGLAQFAESFLSSPDFVTWHPSWSANVFGATAAYTFLLTVWLCAGRPLRRLLHLSPPESAPLAAASPPAADVAPATS